MLPDETPGPEERTLVRERDTELHTAVDALPPRHRYVVVEHFIRDRTMCDIAQDLAVSRSRVSQLCTDAMRRLRMSLHTHGLDTHGGMSGWNPTRIPST